MAASHTGLRHSAETKAKMAIAHAGLRKSLSAETRATMSVAQQRHRAREAAAKAGKRKGK